jgi:hypothetical protein
MPKRRMANYLFLTRNANGNLRYSANADKQKPRRPRPTILYRMKDFLTNNVIAWIIHTWHIRKRFVYPLSAGGSKHPMVSATTGGDGPVSICIAADWATGTPQAAYIGQRMASHSPDYTIHLGDTYYSGADSELTDNYGNGKTGTDTGLWPRGAAGSFALLGNHEMYSSGSAFYNMIGDPSKKFGPYDVSRKTFLGQPVPFFCLLSEHWTILGLDTGYDSLQTSWWKRLISIHPTNLDLQLPDLQLQWLQANPDILAPGKGIVLLSHHQYISAFSNENEFPGPAGQLKKLLGNREVLWIWGHEHRFALYNKYSSPDGARITSFGRCIGNGSMIDEHLVERQIDLGKAASRGLELYDYRVADTFHFDDKAVDVGYNGYAHLVISGDNLEITYCQAYWNGNPQMKEYNQPAITEIWRADGATGNVIRQSIKDYTIDPGTGKSGLSLPPFQIPPAS